jgi:hypothetical protein
MKLSQIQSIALASVTNGLYRFEVSFKSSARHALRDGGVAVILGSNKAQDVLDALDVKGKAIDGRIAIATLCSDKGIEYTSNLDNASFIEDAQPSNSKIIDLEPSQVPQIAAKVA